MYCPNCGSDNKKTQNYCRFCGLNLVEIARSLKNQLAFGEKAYALKKSDKLKRILSKTSVVLVAASFIGLVLVLLVDRSYLGLLAQYSLGIFLLLQVLSFVIDKVSENTVNKQNPARAEYSVTQFESKETAKLLEDKPFEPIGSIVENSTELLPVENKTRKFE